jgi:CDGSH-type Zn-finger protein
MESMAHNTVALRRCGGSRTQPLCDSIEAKSRFRVAQRAVGQQEGRV